MLYIKKRLSALLLLSMLATLSSNAFAAPKAKLWARWTEHDATSALSIDHQPWSDFLARYVSSAVDGVNRFDYAVVSASHRKQLQRYLASLSATEISRYNRDQQRAYWINLYNALTVETILTNYPLSSIRDISSGFFSSGPWDKKLIKVEGLKLTLNDIEHRILRPIWQDPRIHYAVNCASIGCPNLQPRAFTAARSEAMLDQSAREFINHPRAATVSEGKLKVSSIFQWFEADFGGDDAGVIKHLLVYADPALRAALADIKRVTDDDYDWSLNALN